MDDTPWSRTAQTTCLECGAEQAGTAEACARCGAPMGPQRQTTCLECGAESAVTAEACARCGAPIGQRQPAAADPAGGGYADSIPPLPADAVYGPPGQRTGPGSTPRQALIAVGVGLVLFAGLIAVIGEAGLAAQARSAPSPAANQLTWDQLRAGDCLAGSNMGLGTNNPWPEYVTKVACTQRHEAEVFYTGTVWAQSLAYPGDSNVVSQADARCEAEFAPYDGIAYEQSALSYNVIVPNSPSSWASGGRSVQCVAFEPDSSGPSGATPVDSSIKGSDQ